MIFFGKILEQLSVDYNQSFILIYYCKKNILDINLSLKLILDLTLVGLIV